MLSAKVTGNLQALNSTCTKQELLLYGICWKQACSLTPVTQVVCKLVPMPSKSGHKLGKEVCTNLHQLTPTPTHTLTHTPTRTHTHSHPPTPTPTHPFPHSPTPTRTHPHPHPHTHSHPPAPTPTSTPTPHTHTHTHPCIYNITRCLPTHTHPHTHTTQAKPLTCHLMLVRSTHAL